jgi:hypothetical protein
MSGPWIAPIIIPAVMLPVLFGWIWIVYYADSHPSRGNLGRLPESQLSADAVESGPQAPDGAALEAEPGTDSTRPPAGPPPAGPPRQRDRRAAAAESEPGAGSGRR